MANFNKKHFKNNRLKAHCLTFFILIILFLTPVLVNSLEIDNLKGDLIIDETTSKYGKLTIYNWNVIGKLFDIKLVDLELKENTDMCGTSCSSETEIIMYKEGVLVDDVKFVGGEVSSYQFYIKTGEKNVGELIEDYETTCIPFININGSETTKCTRKLVGSYYEKESIWEKYTLGDVVGEGTYLVKLEGRKNFYETTDWQITTQGKLIDEWADWGAGGDITYDGDYTVHTFRTSAYFNVTSSRNITVLVVAGGGGGGDDTDVGPYQGGGGAGGLIYNNSYILYSGNYPVIVGTGGGDGLNGLNSSFGQLEAKGGGAGGNNQGGCGDGEGKDGGSGGGGAFGGCVAGNPYLGTDGVNNGTRQGYHGGNNNNVQNSAGGGGGASEVGEYGDGNNGGDGGDGLSYSINGTAITWAGGGGAGGSGSNGVGGAGGGGAYNVAGLDGYGGGGGGSANGGDGIVIIRYETSITSTVTSTLVTPTNYTNSTSSSITFNCSAETDSLSGEVLSNITLWLNTTGTWVLNETKNVNGTSNSSVFTKNIPDGINHMWTCKAFDNSSQYAWASPNRSFSVDATYPQLTLNLPTETESYGVIGMEQELNWSASDDNFASVWYNYNGSNVTLNGAINSTTFILETSPYNLTIWVNDTFGQVNSTTINWAYKVFENNRTFENSALSFDTENFLISVNYNSSIYTNIVGKLIYNSTSTSSTKAGAEANTIFSANKILPWVLGKINKTFYWSFTLTNSSGSSFLINTTSSEQAVTGINFSSCDGTNGFPYLNFTFKDELNSSSITGTFAATFEFWTSSSSGSNYKTYSFENTSQNSYYSFCVSPNYTNININMDAQYGATGYSDRTYYFNNYSLTNTTSVFNLSLLNTSSQTKFYVTVKNGIDAFTDAFVYVYKYYPGSGDYNLIGVRETDSAGEFIEYLELDEKYNFGINKSGVSYGSISKTASCSAAPCELTLQIDPSSYDIWEEFNDEFAANIISNITYNSTSKVVTYKFTDITATANYFRFIVGKVSFNLSVGTTICDEYLYASSGIITCNVSGYSGDFIAKSYISRSPEILDQVFQFIISDAYTELGLLGIFLNVAILVTMIFSAAVVSRGSPSAVVFVAGATILLLKIGGLFPYSWYVVTPIELIIVWLLIRSEK